MIKDFEKLTLNERADYVWQHAKYINNRSYYGYSINLYGLNGTYIEVWYFENTQQIEKVEVLKNEKIIEQYLKQLN